MESKWLIYVLFTLFLLEGLWCQGCWDQERTALLQLKAFFTKLAHLKNWERGEQNLDCCQWKGIECNSTSGRVITLNLSYKWFEEKFDIYMYTPSGRELENVMYLNASLFLPFVELKSLHLAGNGIAGCMENEGLEKLFKLRHLEIIDLYSNQLTNNILSYLSELLSLKCLYLVNNNFQASNHANGFEKLSKLRNLEILDLHNNQLNHNILTFLSELPSLKSLDLGNNKFQASNHADGFKKLSKLRNLETLDLHNNQLNNSILIILSELPSLKSLYLGNNKLQISNHVDGFERFSKLRNLEILDLQSNMLNNSTLSFLSELPSLKSLNLAWSNLLASNHGFLKLSKKLNHLENLNLEGNFFNNSILLYLTEFLSFKSLNLADNKLQASNHVDGFERFSKLRKLESLDLSYNMLINNSILSSLSELPSLKFLYLAEDEFQASSHADVNLEKLSRLDHLEVLDLSGRRVNFSYNILSFLASLPYFKALFLGSGKIKMNPSKRGFHNLSKVEELFLDNSILPTNFFHGIGALTSLKVLSLHGCRLNDSLTLQANLEKLSRLDHLEVLDLCGRINCSYNILSSLASLPSLKAISLGNSEIKMNPSKRGFHNLSKVEQLLLDNSILPTNFFHGIGALTFLKVLSLHGCQVNDSLTLQVDLEKLSRLHHLEVLDLCGRINFNYNILSSLASLPSLKAISLGNSEIKMNPRKRGFHNLSKVEELFLDNSILPTNFFYGIGALTSLKVLSLYDWRLNDSLTLQGLCELTHLEELDVTDSNLGGALPSCLSNLTSLLSLSLNSNKFFGDIALSPLNKLTSLHDLSLSNNHFRIPISLQPFFNNSKLKHIYVENIEFYIDSNIESLESTFQLNTLTLSGCGDCGAIPNFLYSQHDLEHLDLLHLNLTGEFPIWLLENNTSLKTLSLVNNSLFGPIELPTHSHMSLEYLDISKNFLNGHIPMEIRASLPSLLDLNISKNSLTGSIPPSIGDMELLQYLDLSHNNLSGSIPPIGDMELLLSLDLSHNNLSGSIPPSIGDMELLQFLDLSHNNLSGGIPEKLTMGCSSLSSLILSNNNLQGQIFSKKLSLFVLQELRLNDNHFSGSIPKSLSSCSYLTSIDFSNNNLSGRIASWMGNMSYLQEIIISNNGLEGPIPIDFCQLQFLLILDLSNNNISGSLPSCFSLRHIVHVHLSKNKLEGSLTTQFCKSSSLVTLDLSDNQLSGNIPDCINMLGELSYLILKNNNLEGKIPFQLCKLQKLSLIDLSQNHLSGHMPSCLNLTTDELYNEDNRVASASSAVVPLYSLLFKDIFSLGEPVHFTTKHMAYSYRGRLLTYMSGIDLSCNKLIGEIPYEIGYLSKIRVLNLSHNFLVGGIPSTFSNLKQIESLDLSYNNLSGKIPPELVELYFLSTFSVAYNNLSGKTPARIRQFATFDGSCYQGNHLLCGEPMKSCSTTSPPPMIQEGPTQGREDDGFIDIGVFYMSLIVSYIMVLITIAIVLYINPYWRQAWFYYTEMCFISSYYFIVDHLSKL